MTGGAGFIGSALARALIARGDEVRILDNLSTGLESNLPPGAEFIQGDLRDLKTINDALAEIEAVFHQAAFKSVPKSIDDPLEAETSNVVGTLNLLMAAERRSVRRVIYASSSSAYGDADGTKFESMPTSPISPYGVSKLSGEHYCRVWTRVKGISTVSLRYFNVFGPGQRPDSQYAAVFPAFISALVEGTPGTIHGDGKQTRDFTFIDDVVRANLNALDADDRVSGQVINVCAGSPRSVLDVYETIENVLGVKVPPTFVPRRIGDILNSCGDITRASEFLGWAPQSDWGEAVRATVEWFQELE